MIDFVAADADPAKLKDEIAITVIVARTLDFFIFLAPLHALVFVCCKRIFSPATIDK